MFIKLNQLRTGDYLLLPVKDIKHVIPDVVTAEGEEKTCSVIYLYSSPDDPWFVRQTVPQISDLIKESL